MFNPLHLSHRELRGLAILLVLLPLAPGALVGWSMYQKEKTRHQEQTVSALAAEERRATEVISRITWPSPEPDRGDLADHLRQSLNVPFSAIGDDGQLIAGEPLHPSSSERVLSIRFPDQLPLSSVTILVREPDYTFAIPAHEVAVLVVVFVGLLAGWAVTRQLRINEIANDSLSTVAHELKTPISSSRVLLESLSSGSVSGTKDTQEYVDILLTENARLQDLAENFLTHSKLEGGGMAMDKAPLPVASLLENVVERFLPRAAKRGGTIELTLSDSGERGGEAMVYGDRGALLRLLGCLVDNALKYSPDAPEICIRAKESAGRIDIEVADRGIGIPIDRQRRVFDKFYQVDQRLRRQQGGCGLGLAIAKRLVKEHKGEISMARNPGGGTIVHLSLPSASRRIA